MFKSHFSPCILPNSLSVISPLLGCSSVRWCSWTPFQKLYSCDPVSIRLMGIWKMVTKSIPRQQQEYFDQVSLLRSGFGESSEVESRPKHLRNTCLASLMQWQGWWEVSDKEIWVTSLSQEASLSRMSSPLAILLLVLVALSPLLLWLPPACHCFTRFLCYTTECSKYA